MARPARNVRYVLDPEVRDRARGGHGLAPELSARVVAQTANAAVTPQKAYVALAGARSDDARPTSPGEALLPRLVGGREGSRRIRIAPGEKGGSPDTC